MKTTMTVTRCDFDNTEGATTTRFGLDGREYEVDLSVAREKKLRDLLAPYVERARKAGTQSRTVVRSRRGAKPALSGRERAVAIREWAQDKGYEVPSRGRIRADIIAAYDAEVGR